MFRTGLRGFQMRMTLALIAAVLLSGVAAAAGEDTQPPSYSIMATDGLVEVELRYRIGDAITADRVRSDLLAAAREVGGKYQDAASMRVRVLAENEEVYQLEADIRDVVDYAQSCIDDESMLASMELTKAASLATLIGPELPSEAPALDIRLILLIGGAVLVVMLLMGGLYARLRKRRRKRKLQG